MKYKRKVIINNLFKDMKDVEKKEAYGLMMEEDDCYYCDCYINANCQTESIDVDEFNLLEGMSW